MSRVFVGLIVLAGGWLLVGVDGGGSEQQRLRSHFDSVLVELNSRDVSGLTSAQRSSRSQLIGWLAEYRDDGRFPVNDRYAQVPTPIFRDVRGVSCAMAYLIERSGRLDIVDDISATRNLAYIRELADDSRLVAWLDSVGLDAAEAARIQPAYEEERQQHVTVAATVATVGLSAISLYTAHANAFRPSELRGFAGILVGSVTALVGVVISHEYPVLTGIDAVSGGLAILSGIYAAFRPRNSTPPKSSAVKKGPEWSPLTQWNPERDETRIGLSVRY